MTNQIPSDDGYLRCFVSLTPRWLYGVIPGREGWGIPLYQLRLHTRAVNIEGTKRATRAGILVWFDRRCARICRIAGIWVIVHLSESEWLSSSIALEHVSDHCRRLSTKDWHLGMESWHLGMPGT